MSITGVIINKNLKLITIVVCFWKKTINFEEQASTYNKANVGCALYGYPFYNISRFWNYQLSSKQWHINM